MPPPVTFFDITSVPYSKLVTVAEFNAANEIWFKFITAVDVAFGSWTSKPGGLLMFTNIYQSDGTTLITRVSSSRAFWQALDAGTYYIKLDIFPVGPIAADLTYEADTELLDNLVFEDESVMIPDDRNTQLSAIILETDGNIPTFVSTIPTGEIGDALPNGYVLVHDRFGKYTTNALVLFNPDLTLNQVIVPSTPFTGFPRICHSATDFYAVNPLNGQLWKITTAGACTLIATIPEILAGGVDPVGINAAGTIVYFAINDDSGDILKYVISGGVTSTLYTIPGFTTSDKIALTFDSNPGDLIVLPNGSMVTWWTDDSETESKIIHISAAGTLLNTIIFSTPGSVDHLAYASTVLSTHIKVWEFLDVSATRAKIGNVNLTTGVFDTSFSIDVFDSGQNTVTNGNTKFGPSESCPMFTLFSIPASPEIFKIVPNKRTDYNVAIPNPTFKTALVP